MYFKSKRITLIILAVTATLCSRAMFLFINDTEGPNLLVVTVLASVIFFLSLISYLFKLELTGAQRLLLVVFIQILITVAIFSVLNIV